MRTGEDLLAAATLWRESDLADDDLDTPGTPDSADGGGHARESLRSIWVSDAHLGTRGCRAEALADFLKHHRCDNLFLVGDIVDGWRLKSKMYWPQAHSNVIRRVLTKAKRGCRVVYVTGNHDEFLRRYSNLELGNIVLCDSAEHVTADGRRLLMIHGDQYDAVVQGHKWLAFLGDKGYEFLLVLNRWFNRFRERFGFGYWSLSAAVKHRVKKAVNFISDFEDAVAWDCRRRGFDGVVCGHIHHAEIRDFDGVTYYNCGDWVESCTALVERHDGTIELRRWLTIDHTDNREAAAEAGSA
jgi:UDP-2,3-diacylglucosamine pyrophosphatase LpxH